MNRTLLAIVVVVIIVIAGIGGVYYASTLTKTTSSSSSSTTLVSSTSQSVTSSSFTTTSSSSVTSVSTTTTSSSTSTSTSMSTSTTTSEGYYFLIFTQKGIAELASPTGSLLGFDRLFNISDSVTAQTYYWDEYPIQGVTAQTFLLPLNNGTVKVLNINSMKIVNTISVGTATGFIGVTVNPNQTLAAIADGPSGVVEVMNLNTGSLLWRIAYNTTKGTTAWPCDLRWTLNGDSIIIPMKLNNTVVSVNPTNGAITADEIFPSGTQPYMLTINPQGTIVATELAGNKTDVFLSLPSLKPLGDVVLNATNFSPQRGIFTPDGKYYLEASGSSNVVDVISTSTFQVVNTLSLPASSTPGLADIALTPDSNYAYVVMHGTPSSGGVIYLIPLANIATISASSLLSTLGSIQLTTAPAIALPISISLGTYLADNVLSPPVTGLHC